MVITLVLLGVMALVLGYFQASKWLWIAAFTLIMVLTAGAGQLSAVGLVLLTMLVLMAGSLFLLPSIRRAVISRPLLVLFRKTMPEMSGTEREAIESGDTWWDAELFSGHPSLEKLLSLPASQLNEEEQAFLDGPVERLCEKLDDWEITENLKDLPEEVWSFMKDQGFFGMIIPRSYGGLQFSAAAHSAVVMKIATRSITAAVTVMVPNSLGPGELLLRYGTDQQKDYFLPRLATGKEIPCFALTAPEAGSDAGSMTDTGIIAYEVKNDPTSRLGIRLHWEKRYITLGPVATLLGIAFKLYDPQHLLSQKENIGISLALIPANTPGIEIGERHNPLGIPFQNGPNRGNDVFIPLESLIGGIDYAGKGWRMLTECLAQGRGISLPSLATGAAKHASRVTGAYSAVREQFHVPIARFEGVQQGLGRIGGLTYVCDAARQFTLSALDEGINPSVSTAILKYHLTEMMRHIVNDAMDIHGGKAIMLGPKNYLARIYQSIPISITVEGANILTRNMMIYGQGAIRCHPFVLKEIEAAGRQGQAAVVEFDQLIARHGAALFTSVTRSLIEGLARPGIRHRKHRSLRRQCWRQISRFSSALLVSSDISMMLLGGSLKRREALSARLGDVLSHLYLASAVLKFYVDHREPEDEAEFYRWAMEYCLYSAQDALLGLFRNYPNRFAGRLLRLLVFPRDAGLLPPADQCTFSMAEKLGKPGGIRERLLRGIYFPKNTSDPLAELEQALELREKAEPILQQLKTNTHQHPLLDEKSLAENVKKGLISAGQAELLNRLEQLKNRVIAVDAFPAGAPR
ncbi:MAG: acyl-CoA dehydrogenase [Thiotrichales bacterium]